MKKYWQPGVGVFDPHAPSPQATGPCQMCYGRGYTWVEDNQGQPTHQVACPFCHGTQNNAWEYAQGHREQQSQGDRVQAARNVMLVLIVVSIFGAGLNPIVWFCSMAGAWASFCYWRSLKHRYQQQQADPFMTENEARKIAQSRAAVSIGVALAALFRHHRH